MFETDKVALGYLPTYLRLASQIGITGRVCEVGVEAGRSLLMWQTLFPQGTVVGVDNNPALYWPPGTHAIVSEQNDPALPSLVSAISPTYDLIVDDASHNGNLTRVTFDLLWPLVAPGRWYVIEDWSISVSVDPKFPHDSGGMLVAVQSLLRLLNGPNSELESLEYRHGLAIARKRNRTWQD